LWFDLLSVLAVLIVHLSISLEWRIGENLDAEYPYHVQTTPADGIVFSLALSRDYHRLDMAREAATFLALPLSILRNVTTFES